MRSSQSSKPIRGLMLAVLTVTTALGSVVASSAVSASAGPGTHIVLADTNGSLLIGHPVALTATIEDASNATVTSGPDSTVNVTFTQISGSGSVSGLGTFAAVNGVATDTVTGTALGTVNFQASATLAQGPTTSNTLADGYSAFHGIGVAKNCLGTRQIGQPYECSYKISNNEETAPDTLTITSIVDKVLAFDGTVTSSNLLPGLSLTFTGGASCNGLQTLCTLPFGATIQSGLTSFYTVQPDDYKLTNHKLTDTADFTWQDLCDGGSGNCAAPNTNDSTAPGSSTVSQFSPSVSTALTPSGPVLVGTAVSDQATLIGSSTNPTASGTVTYGVYSDSGCTSLVTSLGTKTVTGGSVPASSSWTSTVGNYWFQATYSGDSSNAGPVSSTCSSEPLTVEGPSIGITKLPATQTILTGGTATWTIVVTNTGNVPLTSVNVTDALAPLCNATFTGTLAVGASETGYSCSLAGVTAGFTNVAVATGTPPLGPNVTNSASAAVVVDAPSIGITKLPATQTILTGGTATWTIVVTNTGNVPLTAVNVTDALAPLCNATFTGTLAVGASETGYSCSLAGVTAGFTNVAVATGTPPLGPNVTHSASAAVVVESPSIGITKLPASQAILSGGTATWTIVVTNTGNEPLTSVNVSDALAPLCNATFTGTLAVGASETGYSCSLADVTAGFTNVAVATGTPPLGPNVTNSASAVVTVDAPSIGITKLPASQTILTGGTATWTIVVTNTGNVPLSDVNVADALAPLCDATFTGSLAAGASETGYSCSLAGVTAGFTNVAVATGTPPVGPNVTNSASAAVVVDAPSIGITKLPATQTILTGGTATWTIVVTNTGNVPLTAVNVTDALAPLCDATFTGSLAAGASETGYSCSLAGVTAGFTNVAVATGTPPLGPNVTNSASAAVVVDAPSIGITKLPATQTILTGGTATWTIVVTNTGNVPLTSVNVTDALAPLCDATFTGTLAAGASETGYSCSLADVTTGFTNVAVATGTPPLGPNVTHSASAAVVVEAPSIGITKLPASQTILTGGTASWTIVVTNTGNVPLSNVGVADALAPLCDATFTGSLAAGASETGYSCSLADVTAGFTNVAVATGTPPLGPFVTNSASAVVTVDAPSIGITKLPATQTILTGGTASWTIVVTNTGNVPLTSVNVTDALAPLCNATFTGTLAVGASETGYSCSLAGVTAGFTNVAVATGTPPLGPNVTNSASAAVVVDAPSIGITKLPATQTILTGGTASWTIVVTNTGNVPLTSVNVTDALAPLCNATFTGTLAVGASETGYSCSLAGVTAGFTNVAVATGTPPLGPNVTNSASAVVTVDAPSIGITKLPASQTILTGGTATWTIVVTNTGNVPLTAVNVTDALAPLCNATFTGTLAVGASETGYSCSLASVTTGFTNVAVTTGTPPLGPNVTNSASAVVTVDAPSIGITKLPATQTILTGGTATWTIVVTNTGNVPLTAVNVTDALAPLCNATFTGTLAVGASETGYSCSLAGVTAGFTNVAVATGTPPLGPNVTHSASAVVTVNAPSIGITKLPATQTILTGGTATWTIVVTNTGNVPLTDVDVTDALAPLCDATFTGTLAVGASETGYSCSLAGVTAGFTNVAVATGTPPVGPNVTNSASAAVVVDAPSIGITKLPASQTILTGGTATWTIVVTNTGNVPLTGVAVTDALAPLCDATFTGTLAVGASETGYSCSLADVTAGFTNIAVATGTPPLGPAVTNSASAAVVVDAPSIGITKLPASQTIVTGGTATWTIVVTNTGNVPLTGVAVTDALAPLCDATFTGTLAVGASETGYSCSLADVTAGFTNIAVATGTPPLGPAVTNSASAAVVVDAPSIGITKLPASQTIVTGGTATWTIVVTNTGNVPLSGVNVTDALAPLCDATFTGTLAVGASETGYSCSLAGVTTGFTNIAVATGTPPLGPAVTNSASAAVVVDAPSIGITKLPASQTIVTGGTATWTIVVTNTGNVPLTGVAVTDALAPLCDATFTGTLAVGASETGYSCSLADVTAGFTNVAVATGTPPVGANVTNSASAVVTVDAPSIGITKLPASQTIVTGGTATWTIVVTNTGNVPLTSVAVTDALAPLCNATFTGTLAVGASETGYSCSLADVTTGFTNIAVATGTPPLGPAVTNSASAAVVVDAPSIGITKLPASQTIVTGGTATWTIVVTNTGNVPLTGVAVTDALAPLCDATFTGTLAVGGSETGYSCSLADVTTGFTNVAIATGTPPVGPAVTNSASAVVTVNAPSIGITKLPATQSVASGGTATWTIVVTNTGNVPLTGVAVTDALAPLCDATFTGTLAVGASETGYSCSLADVTTGFTNIAVATGTPPVGPAVTNSASAVVTLTVSTPPATKLKESVSATIVSSGTLVTFTYKEKNTGKVGITGVTVTGSSCGPATFVSSSNGDSTTLDPGATWLFRCKEVVTNAGSVTVTITDTATATGTNAVTGAAAPPETASASVQVRPAVGPCGILVTVSPNPLLETGQSEVHAVVQVEACPSFAGDTVNIDSSQLAAVCSGAISFGSLQPGFTLTKDGIEVILDDDGNATVSLTGTDCAPGTSVIEADLTEAPFLTSLTKLTALPPNISPSGVLGFPADEVETGNTTASGNSDVYAVFYIETDPVYAENSVEIDSAQLLDRCLGGVTWTSNQGTSTGATATATLDDDGNAVITFEGASCAAGPSTVIADVLAGSHSTYTTTYTILPPQPTPS